MKKILMTSVVLGGVLAFTSPLLAQTYLYVKEDGSLRVEAAAAPAVAIDSALNRAPTSGVMLVEEEVAATVAPVDVDTEVYSYVTVDGDIAIHPAESPEEAIRLAEDISPTSGVILTAR